MAGLGWKILKEGEYVLSLPPLSEAEEQLLVDVEYILKERMRFKNLSTEEEIKKEIRSSIEYYAEKESLIVDPDQFNYLTEYLYLHLYKYCFLDEILEDEDVEEISIIGVNKPTYVFVRKEGWKKVNALFTSREKLVEVANKMARKLGRTLSFQNPRLDAVLDNSRLHASTKPVSDGEITIRRFRVKPFSPSELVLEKTFSAKVMAFLSLLMQSDSSVVIGGNTASGKTTTLNTLFSFVPKNERILIMEDTPEISIPHEHQLRMIAAKEMGILLKDLIYDSLRMRPDRTIIGEVRSKEEIEALFDSLLSGQARGCYATMHARSAGEAISRFKRFGISEMDIYSLDAVVIQRRMLMFDGRRGLYEVRRMTELFDVGDKKVVFQHNKNSWKFRKSALIERLSDKLSLSQKEFLEEWKRREHYIIKNPKDFYSFFEKFQKKFFGL